MIRVIALLAGCAMLAACGTMATTPNAQGGPIGPQGPYQDPPCRTNSSQMIVVKYSGSSIDVTHRIDVTKNKFFVLRLDPENTNADPVDYKTMNVYLLGGDTNATWLNATYNADGQNQKDFDICADAPAGEYKYLVVIPGIGTIDPRVVVKEPT